MRKFTLFSIVAIFAMALVGCSTTANTNTNLRTNAMANNSNVIIVTNANTMNANMMTNGNMRSANVSREEYDRNRAQYDRDKGNSTIGTGANDSWLWFKTKAALATTDDLRDSTINVDVANDVVTLRGTVASKAESDKAASVAKGIDGVKSVTNQLKVQPADSMTNQMTSGNSNMSNANRK